MFEWLKMMLLGNSIKEWKRIWACRNLMKQNEGFLPTWHVYIGYSLDAFEAFSSPRAVDAVAKDKGWNKLLLANWVEVGLAIGHLTKNGELISTPPHILNYYSRKSTEAIGALAVEMMELHIQTLLDYKKMMTTNTLRSFSSESHGPIVAETSTFLEKMTVPHIIRLFKSQSPQRVLDVGCGFGNYMLMLSQHFPTTQFVGIEANKEVSERARSRVSSFQNIQIKHLDVFHANWEELGQFDVILLNNILYYFSYEDRKKLISRLNQQLSTNGTLFIASPLMIQDQNEGQKFTAAFNSFMSAHENLFNLPSLNDIESYAGEFGLRLGNRSTIVPEGGWYGITLTK